MKLPLVKKRSKQLRPLNDKDNIEKKSFAETNLQKRQVKLPKARPGFYKSIAITIVAAVAGFGGGWLGSNQRGSSTVENRQQIISSESQLVNEIAKTVGESVVSVNVSSQTVSQNIFGFAQPQTSEAAGTGFILTKDGLVITNRHVVPAGSTDVSVTLSDGTELDNVEVVGRTSESDPLDIAFLQIKDTKGKTLTPVVLGDSSKVQVGDKVVAIGNALGQFQNTVTSGIISGYGRSIEASDGNSSLFSSSTETLQNLFQTDAAINLGNSGGPLVNVNDEVIAINVAMADAQNIGFAIPINDVKGLIASVEKNGKLERPYLGVRYVSLTDDYAYYYNLDVKRGAYIAPSSNGRSSIISGSPADKAGLKEKDIITSINDQSIDENNSLVSVLGRYQVGDKVTLTVHRAGQDLKIDVTLAAAGN